MSGTLLTRVSAAELGRARRSPIDRATLDEAGAILSDIEARGDAGVIDHARRLGDLGPGDRLAHDAASLKAAAERMPAGHRALLERAAGRIKAFADAQRACMGDLRIAIEGGEAGHDCVPVDAAGCYAPGGRYPLPSSVLMTVIAARSAGVGRVWVASPRPVEATLAAAHIAGADGLLAIGGAQAMGALALGLCGAAACDVIVGPGNRWVTAAKHLVSDRAGIDMLAGPSELLIIADDSADAGLIARDLLAQAEHDDDALPILISTSAALLARVEGALGEQLATLPTGSTARRALGNGCAVLAGSIDEALRLSDLLGPEHLQVMTRDAAGTARRVRHAGAIFIGGSSAEVLGDYGAGPNHVLPTGGTARFRAGLSVFTFLRARTWLRIDDPAGARELTQDAAALARIEGLEGHARAAEARG